MAIELSRLRLLFVAVACPLGIAAPARGQESQIRVEREGAVADHALTLREAGDYREELAHLRGEPHDSSLVGRL